MTDPIRTSPLRSTPASPTGASLQTQRTQAAPSGSGFADALQKAQNVRFSNHAQKRLETRNIALTDDGISRLAQAVDRAAGRGGRESLVMMDDLAFLVNVKERLVITAIDAQSRGEGVFTQIDSVVFADPQK